VRDRPGTASQRCRRCGDGPYRVSGPVLLTDVDGRQIPYPDPVILCRCGQSGNRPFCDGTHLTIDFDGTLAS
jgi:CDGSH-type Zn-finger protein